MPQLLNLIRDWIPVLILILLIALLPVIYRIILFIVTKRLLNGKRDRRTPVNLVRLNMRSAICGEALHFKDPDDREEKRYITVPLTVVTKGGIHLFQIFTRSGTVHSPRTGPFAVRNKEGAWERIPSPITASIQSAKAVRRILEEERIDNVPITVHVILLSDRVKFSQTQEEFLPLSDLITLLRNQNAMHMLTGIEIGRCKKAILKHAGK